MNKIEKILNNSVSHYNDKKYWKMKRKLYDKNTPKFLKYIYIYNEKNGSI